MPYTTESTQHISTGDIYNLASTFMHIDLATSALDNAFVSVSKINAQSIPTNDIRLRMRLARRKAREIMDLVDMKIQDEEDANAASRTEEETQVVSSGHEVEASLARVGKMFETPTTTVYKPETNATVSVIPQEQVQAMYEQFCNDTKAKCSYDEFVYNLVHTKGIDPATVKAKAHSMAMTKIGEWVHDSETEVDEAETRKEGPSKKPKRRKKKTKKAENEVVAEEEDDGEAFLPIS